MGKKKRSKRTVVGSPLTPGLLRELGAIHEFVFASEDFKPDGNWVNTYRIWTCHGYRESGNYNVGFLRIQKKVGGESDTFELCVKQTVVQTDAMLSTIEAHITCLNNEYASPVKWQVSSHFFGPRGKSLDTLSTAESVSIEGETMTIKAGAGILHRQVDAPLTSDWSLFEAAQRWDVGEARHLLVTMLEGLRISKPRQHITYRGLSQMEFGSGVARLYCFAQLGNGILPTEYWLDERHRLLIVTSMNKAYILDEQAEKAIRQRTEQLRKSYQRVKSARRKKS